MSENKSNPSEEENDIFNKIVGLEESGGKKEAANASEEAGSDNDSEDGKESENGSENRQGSEGGEAEKKEDYESLYKASVDEVHKKYLPMEKQLGELQEKTGKTVDELLVELAEQQEKQTKTEESGDDSKKETAPDVENLKQTVEQLEQKFDQKTQDEVKKTVKEFKNRHKLGDKFYQEELVPVLEGVKHMKNPKTGERYSLDDGLELALSFVKKSTIDEKENKISEYEKSSGNSPSGTSVQNPPEGGSAYTSDQIDIGKRMGVDLS